MKRLLAALLVAAPLAALAAPMTNDDVIKLVRSGLGEDTIVQAINAGDPGFDTSTDGLVKLKQFGVSDRIIQLLISRQSGVPAQSTGSVPGLAPLPAGAPQQQPQTLAATPPQQQTCPDCGTITNIKEVKKKGSASGAGALTGALLGGGVGYAVGGKGHRTAGTLIGAGGGALAGNYIEKNASAGREFRIDVRLDNGSQYTFRYDSMPNWGVGTRVRVVNGQLTSLNY
jgi:outer membrane lipoprotein SlyB